MSESGRGTISGAVRDRTEWVRARRVPLVQFLRTETASSICLVAGIVGALVWFNIASGTYRQVWAIDAHVAIGSHTLSMSLGDLVNNGLMTLFFLVVGLEARREFDLGDLRDRRRFLLPMTTGVVAMALPAGIFLAVLHGRAGSDGWGAAMSTDTALALGALSLLGARVPRQVRLFLLSVFVVDDVVALIVIVFFYSDTVHIGYVIAALVALGAYLLVRRLGITRGTVYALVAVVAWVCLANSGVDPVVLGLALGLIAPAFTPVRDSLDRALGFVRKFREQPTAALARNAVLRLNATQSPNARLQQLYHPWSSFVIVPLFALANMGVSLSPSALAHAYSDPITIGIIVAYLVGKPVAVTATAVVARVVSRGRISAPVGWLALLGSGTIAGVGFTVSVLVATREFHGAQLQDAKIGALTAAVGASIVTAGVFGTASLLSPVRRAAALVGDEEHLIDLVDPVDERRDHIRGPADALVTLVEYGDLECPYCGRAEPIVRRVLAENALDVRYVWRHLPLTDVHPHAQLAAEAAEAAGAQDAFWPMRDLLIAPEADLTKRGLLAAADSLGLDADEFAMDLAEHRYAGRVANDVESADLSGVSGTPTFFLNGLRHHGAYDVESLTAAVHAARERVLAAGYQTG